MTKREHQAQEYAAEAGTPDLRLAIARALQSAEALCGRQNIKQFFEGMVERIIKNHFPMDLGGLVNAKCQHDVGEEITKLLDSK